MKDIHRDVKKILDENGLKLGDSGFAGSFDLLPHDSFYLMPLSGERCLLVKQISPDGDCYPCIIPFDQNQGGQGALHAVLLSYAGNNTGFKITITVDDSIMIQNFKIVTL